MRQVFHDFAIVKFVCVCAVQAQNVKYHNSCPPIVVSMMADLRKSFRTFTTELMRIKENSKSKFKSQTEREIIKMLELF